MAKHRVDTHGLNKNKNNNKDDDIDGEYEYDDGDDDEYDDGQVDFDGRYGAVGVGRAAFAAVESAWSGMTGTPALGGFVTTGSPHHHYGGFFVVVIVVMVVVVVRQVVLLRSAVVLQMPLSPAQVRRRRKSISSSTSKSISSTSTSASSKTKSESKSGNLEWETELVPLDKFMRESCPLLSDGVFNPHPMLPTGDAQTIYAGVFQRFVKSGLQYRREAVAMPDGGTVTLDWHDPHGVLSQKEDASDPKNPSDLKDSSDPKNSSNQKKPKTDEIFPLVLILHGLTGGSHETYVQDLVESLAHRNLPSVVMNFRGCSNTPLTSPQLYSGAYTGDITYCIGHIRKTYPTAVVCGVGFSLGANVLLKYVGQTGVSCPLIGCVSIANPFDLLGGHRALHRTFIGKQLYSRVMATSLRNLFFKHVEAFTEMDVVSLHEISRAKYIEEFDEACTRRAFQFATVEEYYRCGSSAQDVPGVAVTTLVLSAMDDPVAASEVIPWRECLYNPHVVLATTQRGGHLGWFDLTWRNMFVPRKRWFAEPVAQFVHAMLDGEVLALKEQADATSNPTKATPYPTCDRGRHIIPHGVKGTPVRRKVAVSSSVSATTHIPRVHHARIDHVRRVHHHAPTVKPASKQIEPTTTPPPPSPTTPSKTTTKVSKPDTDTALVSTTHTKQLQRDIIDTRTPITSIIMHRIDTLIWFVLNRRRELFVFVVFVCSGVFMRNLRRRRVMNG